jgi:transcriptional regulator with PAS, ATPase and Fis domain
VLEEQSFRRLGGLKDIILDLRVITATNKNLQEAVREGAFRQDLYFRLNVIQISIPALRERPEDILPLANFFVDLYNKKFRPHIEGITPESQHLLVAHTWPGNVRELRNAVERAMILEESARLTTSSLPVTLNNPAGTVDGIPSRVPCQIPDEGISLEENERTLVARALEKTGGNQTQAARLLRITRDTLRYKMKKFHLK